MSAYQRRPIIPLPRRLARQKEHINWNGHDITLRDIISHLQGDILSLQQLSLTSRVFAIEARKVLFKKLSFTSYRALHKWRIHLADFAAHYGDDIRPSFFNYVKELSFLMDRGTIQYLPSFLRYFKFQLPALELVRIYGNGHEVVFPEDNWLLEFILATGPDSLSFHSIYLPVGILEFEFPTVGSMEIVESCIFYGYGQDEKKRAFLRQPLLTATLILDKAGAKWARVEEITTSAMNMQMLKLVKNFAAGIDTLGIRVASEDMGPRSYVEFATAISSVRILRLQVPPSSIGRIPDLIRNLVAKAVNIREIELFYEEGWFGGHRWRTIAFSVMRAIKTSVSSVRGRFRMCEVKLHFNYPVDTSEVLLEEFDNGIHMEARYSKEKQLNLPERNRLNHYSLDFPGLTHLPGRFDMTRVITYGH